MRFGVLGTVGVINGDTVEPVPAKMPRTIFAALLLDANRVVSADRLVEVLWGERPPASVGAGVHNHMSRLRAFLAPSDRSRIRTVAPGYVIDVSDGELDLDVFTRLSGRGLQAWRDGDWAAAARDLTQALALWRGDPLADVESGALQAVEAARLAELRLGVLEAGLDADLQLGRENSVIAELGRLISVHPLRERFHGLLMLALYRTSRQAEALTAYQHARDLLREELGVEPGSELRELHQRMLAADPALDAAGASQAGHNDVGRLDRFVAPPVPSQLPADVPDFAGRDEQVAELTLALTGQPDGRPPGTVAVAAITGPGGIGKTTLAVHVAHQVRHEYPDGQLYVYLRGTNDPLEPADVLARFLRDLGADPQRIPAEQEERAAFLRTLLSDRSVLIVLDDARDTAHIQALLPGAAGCAVLVTSRNRLGELAGLHLDLDELDDDSSAALFTSILGTDRVSAEPRAMTRLVRLCAGLPLAIRIASGRLLTRPGWTIDGFADRMADQRQRLGELQIGEFAVRASFQLSYENLRGDSDGLDPAKVFRFLGLLEGPDIGVPGAAALLGDTEDRVRVALETLVDAYLVHSASTGRYRMHDLMRDYAAERVHAEETGAVRHAAMARLISWYLLSADAAAQVLAPQIRPVLLPPTEPDVHPAEFHSYDAAVEWCESERLNLVAAVNQAATLGMHAFAWRLPVALRRFFRLGKYWADYIATFQIALDSAALDDDRKVIGLILDGLAEPYTDLGQYVTATGYREKALAIHQETGDRQGEARALNNLGLTFGMRGQFEESLSYLMRGLACSREIGDRYLESIALQNTGDCMRGLRRYDDAISYFQRALAIFRASGDTFGQASALHSIGDLYLDLGQHDDAARCYRQAVRHCRSAHDRGTEASALRGLGTAFLRLGRPGPARRSLLQARDIFEAIGDPQAREIDAELAPHRDAPDLDVSWTLSSGTGGDAVA
jgi:DNA-binding SARP family transcriptional activator/Flp pilus assembly protein TadD